MRARLEALVTERERVLQQFLESEQRRIALASHSLARAFSRGATLYAFGTGAAATDAAHVAVEFMHPVIVGKRALPAVALTNDPTGQSATLRLARASDIALGIAHGGGDPAVRSFLDDAARQGLQTIALAGRGSAVRADEVFSVESDDPHVVQEVQETLYHVLWELVHVFFEHPGLLVDACITSIPGPIRLGDGVNPYTTYPSPGGSTSVLLTSNACFRSFGDSTVHYPPEWHHAAGDQLGTNTSRD